MSKSKVILTLLFTVICQVMMAQGKVISGTVEDAMGPVMMANVIERDANKRIVNATQTDMMGNFSMEIKNPKNKLVVSYVGSKTFETVIGDKETFAIRLEDEKTTLTEITVRGRRTNSGGLNIDKREITGAQSTLNMSELDGMAFTSADEALQGEIAGLDIVANSGNLGAGTSMKLRGSTGEPLIVVDDKIFEYNSEDIDLENADNEAFSSLLAVNVDDIASITVLKDAAATAIWGARGADGVISITTKRGQRGKPKMNLSYKFTGGWMPEGYKMLNGDNYTMMLKEALYNKSRDANATKYINEIKYLTPEEWPEANNWNKNTDWVEEVKQFSEQHEANMNISGGGSKASFRISAGFKNQTGMIIKQKLNQVTTRLVLDYNVSDRIKFSTNFALTYTDNLKNYTLGSSKDNRKTHNSILDMAYSMAPNVAIRRTDQQGIEHEYFNMSKVVDEGSRKLESGTTNGVTSYQLKDIVGIGNPVAYANQSWQKEQTYSITPDFNLKYELLGTGSDQTRLTANARVYFDIYANSKPTFRPAALSNDYYAGSYNNYAENSENNNFKLGARAELIFTPHFKNEDFSLTMLARYEFVTGKYSYQFVSENQLPTGIESPNVEAVINSMSNRVSSTRSADHNWIYNAHFSYKGRYSLGFSLRGDGSSKFGPDTPWFISPSVSLRWNVSDESFFKPLRKYISMLGLRGSWGINGSQSANVGNYFNQFYPKQGQYITGTGNAYTSTLTTMSGLKLDDLKPQKKEGTNFGLNLGLFDDIVEFDLDLYKNTTHDMIMENVPIPASSAWGSTITLARGNIGKMENKGWELTIKGNKFLKVGKFSLSAQFNLGQDVNKLLEMDDKVLEILNDEPKYDDLMGASLYKKVEIGKPLNSIYGYRYKGVYQYSYEYLTNYNLRMKQSNSNWSTADYEKQINDWIAEGKTFPVVIGADGKVVMNGLEPQRIKYFDGGGVDYNFEGGDAIYEDTNHDGNINEQDMVYLGNSRPKIQGGFGLTFAYGNWKLITRFTYRAGFKIANLARMGLESMRGTANQCASTTHRWRTDGDGGNESVLPRALYGGGWNSQMSSRYVEDGSFLRFQNIQLSYAFPKKQIKKWGLNTLTAYVTMNRLFTLTKYSGIDPERAPGLWTPASDSNGTPTSRSVTASVSIGF